ncbi:MAG: hypothetical protein IJV65_09025 [Kiritimatiellae bacterium]|nr:hypothetical protein [Kiritimatiellia bacterium]
MKRLNLAFVALLPAICAHAAVPLDWRADVDKPSVAPLAVMRGETAHLRCDVFRRGAPYDLAAASATLYWQTNGMGALWWSAPATVASNVLSATWTPDMDPGASPVALFIGATDADGSVYRAAASLRILHAPGAVPSELPLPVPSLDFATISVTNAPWALAADLPRAISNIVDAAPYLPLTGGTVTGAVFGPAAVASTALSLSVTGSVWYLDNYDGDFALSLAVPDVSALRVGDVVDAEFRHHGNVETWPFAVAATDPLALEHASAPAVSISGLVPGNEPAVTPVGQDARLIYRFAVQSCEWGGGGVSRFVTEADLAADTRAAAAAIAATNYTDAVVASIPDPDYSAANTALVATIEAVAPAPGDYATVSNRAMSAVQTEADPSFAAWAATNGVSASLTSLSSRLSIVGPAATNYTDAALAAYTETDPTVPAWAKAATKPTYTYSEVGAAASSHVHQKTFETITYTGNKTWSGLSGEASARIIGDGGVLTFAASLYQQYTNPRYYVISGWSSLVLPANFRVVGSGTFRPNKENHFTVWKGPESSATYYVNFLFAQ